MLTVLARGLLLAAFYLFVWQSCRLAGAGPKLAAILTLTAALAGSINWATRPQLFSFPLFSLSLFIVWQWQQGQQRYLWLLPVIVALWVNLHGAFILCFFLVGAALVGGGGDRRALAIAFGGMVLASLLNPRFFGVWSYVYTLITDPPSQQLGAEWKPPTNESWQGMLFFGWLLLLIPGCFLTQASEIDAVDMVARFRLDGLEWVTLCDLVPGRAGTINCLVVGPSGRALSRSFTTERDSHP
jgi:hypothetical protein